MSDVKWLKRSLSPRDSSSARSKPISHVYDCVPSAWFCTRNILCSPQTSGLRVQTSIRNKTSCCCQVREGKCTLCPEDYRPLLFSRPFLDMVYHALDSPDDDYHALFVLCLLYAMSHNKGRHAPRHLQCLTQCLRGRTVWEGVSFLASEVTTTMFFFSHITISQVFFADWSHRHWWLRHGGGKFKCGCLTQWG